MYQRKCSCFFRLSYYLLLLSYAQLAGNYCGEKNKGIKVLEFILKNKSEKKKIRIYKQSLHVGHRHCTEVKIFCDGKSMCYFPIVWRQYFMSQFLIFELTNKRGI